MEKEVLTMPEAQDDEEKIEYSLRPKTLQEFIGQSQLKDNLSILLEAAKHRQEVCEHILFYGPPGLGKTTLAHVISHEMGGNIKVTSGPALEKVGDLAAILTNLEEGDILFIDEIHRMNRSIEEVLYPAMEDFALDIIIGKGPAARTLRLDLQRFTLIGATTKLSLIGAPLRDRFGAVYHMDYYNSQEMSQIIQRSAHLLGEEINQDSAQLIGDRSRFTPRIANRLLRRVRDYAQVRGDGKITAQIVEQALDSLNIDRYGLDNLDREILKIMIEKFNGGPVGISTLSASASEEISTIEEVIEPFLLRQGFIIRTPRGRMATKLSYEHLDYEVPMHLEDL